MQHILDLPVQPYDHAVWGESNKLACNARAHSHNGIQYYFAGPFVFYIDYENHYVVHNSTQICGDQDRKWGTHRHAMESIIYYLLMTAKDKTNVQTD